MVSPLRGSSTSNIRFQPLKSWRVNNKRPMREGRTM
ncbi:hypothetical protein CaCOL14_006431 [Colletotrichum acutatum]